MVSHIRFLQLDATKQIQADQSVYRFIFSSIQAGLGRLWAKIWFSLVLHPKKGVCADPVDKGAILGGGGMEPYSSDRERQLAPDIGRGKT